MPRPKHRAQSRYAIEAARLLGLLIRTDRIERKISAQELANRAGISRALLQRVEKGDLGCSIGAVFEVAAILEIQLFDADRAQITEKVGMLKDRLCLLPKKIKLRKLEVRDDF